MYRNRLRLFLIVVCLIAAVIAGRLLHLQVVASDVYRREAEANLVRPPVLIETRRGSILDRNGLVLADDAARFDLCMYYPFLAVRDAGLLARLAQQSEAASGERRSTEDIRRRLEPLWRENQTFVSRRANEMNMEPDEFVRYMADFWPELARRSGIDLAVLDARREKTLLMVAVRRDAVRATHGNDVVIREETIGSRGIAHPLIEDLDERTKAAVVALQARYPFLIIEERAKRVYRYADCAPHVVGYVGEVADAQLDRIPEDFVATGDKRLPNPFLDELADELAYDYVAARQHLGSSATADVRSAASDIARQILARRRAEASEPRPDRGASAATSTLPEFAEHVADELVERRAYRLGDQYGKTGIEAALEPCLRGTRGIEQFDKSGNPLRARRDPVPGRDVRLTLDIAFQDEVEALLDGPEDLPSDYGRPRGAAVVIDIRTGGLLALATTPRFNPMSLGADYPDLIAEGAGRPLFDRAAGGQIALGSIFKIVTACAGLHEGAVTPDTSFFCTGFLYPNNHEEFKCWRWQAGGHGDTSLHRALAESCNVYFYNVGMRLGSQRLYEWGSRFGFGRPVGILLPGEASGSLPKDGNPRNLAIGQGELTATPLQAARLAALIGGGGNLAQEVHLVDSPRTAPPPPVSLALNPGHVARIRRALFSGVNEQGGTGYGKVTSPLVAICGKSGSAETGKNVPTHSWFVGFAPADNPQIAFAVVYERAGGGSRVAGPVARKIVETALRQRLLVP